MGINLYAQINFPQLDLKNGYKFNEVHARVSFPLDGQNRVWVKGSSTYSSVHFLDASSNAILHQQSLKPPYYTDVMAVSKSTVHIVFCSKDNDCTEAIVLNPGYYNSLSKDGFSLLLYGCMEPYKITYEDGAPKTGIFDGQNNAPNKIRGLFNKIATHQSISHTDSVSKKREYVFSRQMEVPLLTYPPKAIITTGDQVYVDAGYGVKMIGGDIHPLSAWETKRRPHLFNPSLPKYKDFLNTLYNASYSFEDIETAHHYLPTFPAIDDHELRDGWGSQGDEYEKGIMNEQLGNAFKLGRNAFIDHQLALSNIHPERLEQLKTSDESMEYAFTINGKKGYVFDLRSARNINNKSILGEAQWKHFETWLEALEMNQEIILVTSVPLTLRPLKWIEDLYKMFKPELRDDARDGWSSRQNRGERNRLLALLTKYRITRDIKPIFVSGDIHKTALIEIWMDPVVARNEKHDLGQTMILGYEVVASGMSHEFLKTGLSKNIFKLIESQNIGDGLIGYPYNGHRASIYPMVLKSVVAQNFAALEFSTDRPTRMHIFYFDRASEQLVQQFHDLDFNKKMPNDDYFEIEIRPNGSKKTTFSPPIPDGKRGLNNF